MADEKENPASATAMPRVRRRAPTIELKATEVAVEPPPAPAESMSSDTEHPVPPDYPTEPPSYETAGAEPPQEPPQEPRQEPPPSPPKGRAWPSSLSHPAVPAAIAGAVAALILFVVMGLTGLFSSSSNGLSDPRVAQIESQLRDIAARPLPRAPDPRASEELNARLTRLENAAADNRPAPAGTSEDTIKAIQTALADLTRRIDDNAAALREARTQSDAARTAADAARLAAEKSNVEALSSRLAALENATKKLSEDVAKSLAAAGGDKALRAVVAMQALRAAVERGAPFASELAAVKTAVPNAQALGPLEPFATSGLPSATALARQLSDLAPVMLQRAGPPPPSGGFLDRLQANAEKLVRVRPIDEIPGDQPAAVISRAQAKSGRGDLSGAVAELKALPADVRAPAEDWIKKVETREAAVKASAGLVSDALAGLGKSGP